VFNKSIKVEKNEKEEGLEGVLDYYIAKIITILFKNRPNCLFVFFAFGIVIVIVLAFVEVQNPNDLVLPILLLAFVLIVVVGRIVGVIRKKSVQESQVIEETPPDQETPLNQETPLQLTEAQLPQTPQRKQQTIQYPRLTTKDRRKVILISAAFLALGYISAQLFFYYMPFVQDKSQIINWIDAEYYNLFIKDTIIQFICGLPCALSIIIPIFIVLLLLLNRFAKPNQKILMIIFVILSFIFGVLFYIPIQIIMAILYSI
jgi:hypothetical protein